MGICGSKKNNDQKEKQPETKAIAQPQNEEPKKEEVNQEVMKEEVKKEEPKQMQEPPAPVVNKEEESKQQQHIQDVLNQVNEVNEEGPIKTYADNEPIEAVRNSLVMS